MSDTVKVRISRIMLAVGLALVGVATGTLLGLWIIGEYDEPGGDGGARGGACAAGYAMRAQQCTPRVETTPV